MTMESRSKKAIDKLGVTLDPGMLIKEMPVGHKQFTEIARELGRENVKLIVLDEPTAVLTESEAETLLASLRTAGRGRHRHHLHLPPAARGGGALRPGRGPPGRPQHQGPPGQGHLHQGDRLPHGGPVHGGPGQDRGGIRRAGRGHRRFGRDHPDRGRPLGGHARRDRPQREPHACRRARSWASAAWRARASWGSPTASWACTRPAARSRCTASPWR